MFLLTDGLFLYLPNLRHIFINILNLFQVTKKSKTIHTKTIKHVLKYEKNV